MKNVASNTQEESANTQGATAGPSIIRPRYALVANKIDQEHLRVIKSERHHKFAQVIYCYCELWYSTLFMKLFLNRFR